MLMRTRCWAGEAAAAMLLRAAAHPMPHRKDGAPCKTPPSFRLTQGHSPHLLGVLRLSAACGLLRLA